MIGLPLLLAAAAACPASPVHREPLPAGGNLSSVPWVQAAPRRAGVVGVLFGFDGELVDPVAPTFALYTRGSAPSGHTTKILWIVRNVHAVGYMDVRGRRLDGQGRFSQSFEQVFDMSARPAEGYEYASIVRIPAAGCWRLDVASGGARGSLVVRAVGH